MNKQSMYDTYDELLSIKKYYSGLSKKMKYEKEKDSVKLTF